MLIKEHGQDNLLIGRLVEGQSCARQRGAEQSEERGEKRMMRLSSRHRKSNLQLTRFRHF